MTKNNSCQTHLPQTQIPIAIGVSGHRDIDCNNLELNTQLHNIFTKIRAKYPLSPFIILSPLAEGADRIVATKAIEELKAELIAVLPFTEEEYMKDFKTEESRKEFQSLLAHAKQVYVMPGGRKGEFSSLEGDLRNAQYSRAGAFVSKHSQFIIAIWDGCPAAGKGGTANIVEWEKSGYVPIEQLYSQDMTDTGNQTVLFTNPLEMHETGAVFHIPYENRKDKDKSKHIISQYKIISGDSKENFQHEISGDKVADKIEDFNRILRDFTVENKYPLFNSDIGNLVGEEEASTLSKINDIYMVCDQFSLKNQNIMKKCLKIIFACFSVAVLSFAFLNLHFAFAVPFVVAMCLIILPSRFASKKQIKEKYVDSRIIAEGLRILFYWRLAGIERAVSSLYLSDKKKEIGWTIEAISNIELLAGSAFYKGTVPEKNTQSLRKRIGLVKRNWVDEQKNYYLGKDAKPGKVAKLRIEEKKLSFNEKMLYGISIALVIICLACWILSLPYFQPESLLESHPILGRLVAPLHDIPLIKILPETQQVGFFQLLLGIFAAFAALAAFKREHEALDIIINSYEYAGNMFELASKNLKHENIASLEPKVLNEVIFQIGLVALHEQGNWLSAQKSLPLAPEKATG